MKNFLTIENTIINKSNIGCLDVINISSEEGERFFSIIINYNYKRDNSRFDYMSQEERDSVFSRLKKELTDD